MKKLNVLSAKKSFGAKRNMKRHVNHVHKAQNDISRNSNRSNVDGILNTDPLLPEIKKYDEVSNITPNCGRLRGLIVNLGASKCLNFCAFVKQEPNR